MAKDRKEYQRRYYLEKIKPHRKPINSTPILRYKCPLCGMLPLRVSQFDKAYAPELKLQFGSRYFCLNELPNDTRRIYEAKLGQFLQVTSTKLAYLLRGLRDSGFISSIEINDVLGHLTFINKLPVQPEQFTSVAVTPPTLFQVEVRK